MKPYSLFLLIFSLVFLAGCREDDFGTVDSGDADGLVKFYVEMDNGDTRGLLDEQKTFFEEGEVIHIRAVFNCRSGQIVKYGAIRYQGHSYWEATDGAHQLRWPDDALSASFSAYYMKGVNGILTENTMLPKLLNDFEYDAIPLFDEVKDKRYGDAVRFSMKHIFTYMTLYDLQGGLANELWFTTQPSDPGDKTEKRRSLNNAFYLEYKINESTGEEEIIPVFTQIPDKNYPDENGKPGLVYIKTKLSEMEIDGEKTNGISFFLEPAVYHDFKVVYPSSRDTYSTYLTYKNDLSSVTGKEGMVANQRYRFSILKSLGVILDQDPDAGWDKTDPHIIVDVESFLRAANSGSDYFEYDPKHPNDEDWKVQILESTLEGTRLLRNVDFRNEYYDVFTGRGYFIPNLSNTFDGNFHYIYNLGCPLFHENYGVITNLGFRNALTKTPVVSNERLNRGRESEDFSHTGFIAARNYGTVVNVRFVNANMTVNIQTSNPDDPTSEVHNASLLFGVNRGNVYDVELSGKLHLTVQNNGDKVIPRLMIGGLAGQNLGIISGVNYVSENGFDLPEITVLNKCDGSNANYKIGGLAGINTGSLDNIIVTKVTVDSKSSVGLGSAIGGLVGENQASAIINSCIVRGDVTAGTINGVGNQPESYVGGIAGVENTEAFVTGCSVTMNVTGTQNFHSAITYGEGGAFGRILQQIGSTKEGNIANINCFGSILKGNGNPADNIGNFAGITAAGFEWDHFSNNEIRLRNFGYGYIGAVK